MAQASFFPWHQDIAQHWLSQQDRFAHAWLIHGLAGIGKKDFALAAAQSLLCESPIHGLACGTCLACGWVESGNHPDLKRIRPEAIALDEGVAQNLEDDVAVEAPAASDTASTTKRAPSKDIRVEQIRAMEPWFNHATHRGGWRVAVIYPAETLTVISANALLKVLEEPPPSTVFLLVADAPDRLLPTLLSRCRRLPLPTPAFAVAQNWLADQGIAQADHWLAAYGGAPVMAKKQAMAGARPCPEWLEELILTLAKGIMPDVGKLADVLAKTSAATWIDPLQRISVDAMMIANHLPGRYFPMLEQPLSNLLAGKPSSTLSDLSNWLNDQRRLAGHPLNPKLFAHAVLQKIALTFLRLQARK